MFARSFVATAPAAPETVARDLHEETQRIAVTVKDMVGRHETRQIPATIFRPRGDGPFPRVVMNHGRATSDRRAQLGPQGAPCRLYAVDNDVVWTP